MHRIDSPTASETLPSPAVAGTPGYFTNGNPATAVPPTTLTSDWFNAVQEELVAIIAAAGLEPDKTNDGQVLLALKTLFAGNDFKSWATTTAGAGGVTVSTGAYSASTWQEYQYNLVLPASARVDIMTTHKQAFSGGAANWAARLNVGGTIIDDAWGSAIEDKISMLGSIVLPAGSYTPALEIQSDPTVSIVRPKMRLAWTFI